MSEATMTCEDFELELGEPALSVAARAHVAGCAACRESYEVVTLAALPPESAAERAALANLPAATLTAWRAKDRRRDLVGRVVGLAVAAGLGAVVATAVLLELRPAPQSPGVQPVAATQPAAEPVLLEAPVVPDLSGDALNQVDDEVFFEVSWPSVTEGEL